MRRALIVAVALVAFAVGLGACRPIPVPWYGITIDNAGFAGQAKLDSHVALMNALPHDPVVRVVIDPGTTPGDYDQAFAAYQPVAYTMALPVDSSAMTRYTVSEYAAWYDLFEDALAGDPESEIPDPVDVWEVGNEVNGNWTGSYATVAAKVVAALNVTRDHGKRAALTLWENTWGTNHCGNGSGEETPEQFSQRFTAAQREQFQVVMISWYPTQCTGKPNGNSNFIPAATIKATMEGLRALYPNAEIGFGEIGIPNPATAGTMEVAEDLIEYYYGLDLGLPAWYIGNYSWWYAAQDACCPHSDPAQSPLFDELAAAMQ